MRFRQVGNPGCISRREAAAAVRFTLERELAARGMPRVLRNLRFTLRHEKPAKARAEEAGRLVGEEYRSFTVRVSPKFKYRKVWLKFLMHELRHVVQDVTGMSWEEAKTRLVEKPCTVWKGRRIPEGKYKYRQQPWEVDARKHERRMVKAWLRHLEG